LQRLARFTQLIAVLALTACGGGGHATSAPSSSPPAATAAPTLAATSAASAEATALPSGATPTPEPTATPDPNLLSWKNGAIVRAYPVLRLTENFDPNDIVEGVNYVQNASGPFVFVYELPGTASIASFTAQLPRVEPSSAPATVTFAVSTSGAGGDFKDVGTLTAHPTDDNPQTLPANVAARWVRVTANGPRFESIGATGTLPPVGATVSPAGIYVELVPSPYKNGTLDPTDTGNDPWYRRLVAMGKGLTAVRCFNGHTGDAYPGTFDGRYWTFGKGSGSARLVLNDDASMIVGSDTDQDPRYLLRTSAQPKFCEPQSSGSGPHHVLVLDRQGPASFWPMDDNSLPGYSYDRIDAGMLDDAALSGHELAIFNMVCHPLEQISPEQAATLVAWVAAGHKLLIIDSDSCTPKTDYSFLPYAFDTSNPGAQGASGDRLIIVENDALGTSDKSDTDHFFDPKTFINGGSNQLGDANIVTTQDAHWCGHLFGTNVKHDNGFMQMYAPYGQGIIIYDGFDHDDAGTPGYERVRRLEFAMPVPASMPCTQSASLSFLIQPNQEATFTSGTASTLHAPMETLANLGWAGHITITTTGDFPATVTPNGFDMSGGTQPLAVTVNVPASTKPGAYTVNVVGTGNDGKTAQASITITGAAPLKKAVLKKHQRIRIYGIHFDVDSAHIQPRSEPVIAQIAALMKDNPAWKFEISGHTDSDGGAAYNLGLSQRRAQAVVNDLVSRYRIARSRMVPKGYGLTRPVATNSTAAGKALNRRVELERLQ
jgi:outer membrane protein OmpA-like peptidoglycan-associated protein